MLWSSTRSGKVPLAAGATVKKLLAGNQLGNYCDSPGEMRPELEQWQQGYRRMDGMDNAEAGCVGGLGLDTR